MAAPACAAIRRCLSTLLWRTGRRQLPGVRVSSYGTKGRSSDAFWHRVVDSMQDVRLAGAIRSGLEGEGQVEGPAQAVFDAVRAFYAGLQQGEEKLSFFTALASLPEADKSGEAPPLCAAVLSQLGRQKGGLQLLVDLRRDLLALSSTPSLCALEEALTALLSQYCSRDLLEVEKVTWQSPSDLIEKISTAEVVHPVRHWKDIKSRLGHNMRCFVLTHRAIPREPLVVLHSALTPEPSASVQDMLHAASRDDCSGRGFSTAVFYSVWLREQGLSGLDLPSLLIKMAAADLQGEFPHMSVFYTLSPVFGFRRWLEGQLRKMEQAADLSGVRGEERLLEWFPIEGEKEGTAGILKAALGALPVRCDDARFTEALRPPLMHLCVRYLLTKRSGRVIDPVANFHLRNGASLYRVNWLADRSARGLRLSYGLMANYCYDMATLTSNSRRYVQDREVSYSPEQLEQWLD